MKNTNDLILSIATSVVAIIIVVLAFVLKQEPAKPSDPQAVVTTAAPLPAVPVQFTNSLAAGGGGGAMGGPMGGMMGGGPPMGMPGRGGPPPGMGIPSGMGMPGGGMSSAPMAGAAGGAGK